MIAVGLTGGAASGKSTVAALLRARGVPVLDADAVAREVVAPGTEGFREVVRRFGPEVVGPDGALDRAALRARVLRDAAARRDLEAITHPRIRAAIDRWLEERRRAGDEVAVVEAALLVETGSWRRFDALLVVDCPPGEQLRRLVRLRGLDEDEARRLLAAQLLAEERRRVATAVVENDGDLDALPARLDAAWARLLEAVRSGRGC